MHTHPIEDQTFEKVDFTQNPLPIGEYEKCRFVQCNFANADISGMNFSECEFFGCNMGLAKMIDTALRDVRFRDCKLLGIPFGNCDGFLFSVRFENCLLNLSSFHALKMKNTEFIDCSLHEVSFVETDLTGSVFQNCDFSQAIFQRTILEKADLRTSHSYSIDPETNKINKAKFSMSGIAGLLDKYDIEINS